jgi:hypothetical protein
VLPILILSVEAGFIRWADRDHAIIDLRAVLAQDPDIASRERRIG